ncbi:type II secretion system GspH family protein [Patescibacteria group bacterium]|nr:type II secretion system GspH family protein [Patescibacteria group bacterium]MBU0801439.1 type II secretion system GspH family protein [Alphaproteobacteria bacterium]MBU1754724.1 type II secretion system GspH family protein [Patescibacteria group bacterium]
MKQTSKGFTLIELLVVIAIIGILSAVVLASLNTARNNAAAAKAKQEILTIAKAAEAARFSSNSPYLYSITGSGCTRCQTNQIVALRTALTNISTVSGVFQGIENISLDPWGNVYLLDENEGEGGSTNCTRDTLTASNGTISVSYKFEYGSEYCLAHPVGVAGFQ